MKRTLAALFPGTPVTLPVKSLVEAALKKQETPDK